MDPRHRRAHASPLPASRLIAAAVILLCVAGAALRADAGSSSVPLDPETRSALSAAAQDPALPAWQREFMRALGDGTLPDASVGAAATGAAGQANPRSRVPGTAGLERDSTDGTWSEIPPPARSGHSAIYDPVRDRMIVFGGSDGLPRNSTWTLSLAGTLVWEELRPSGTLPPAREGHVAIYDPVRDRMLVFGGYDGPGGTVLSDTWALSLAGSPSWIELTPGGAPAPARDLAAAIYDPLRDRLLVQGGWDGAFHADTWALSLAEPPAWALVAAGGAGPSARWGQSAVYDPVRDRMLVFGGFDSSCRNDVFALSLSGSPGWTRLSPVGFPPSGREWQSAIYDPVADALDVFGGYCNGGGALNDTWVLSLGGSPAWTRRSPQGPLPASRSRQTAILDPLRGRMVVYGGYPGGLVRDTWALPLAGGNWESLVPGAGPSARWRAGCTFDALRRRLLVVGGDDGSLRNDVWALSWTGAPAWSQILPSGTPPSARWGHTAVYDEAHDRLILFGGNDGARRNDVWALSLGDSPAWMRLMPGGSAPTARYGQSAIYDAGHGSMIVFGGYDGALRSDTWTLSLGATPAWTELLPVSPPAPRQWQSAVYDPVRDRMLIFGGNAAAGPQRDLWTLALDGTPAWTQLSPAGPLPAARYGHAAVFDRLRDRMIVFGGTDGAGGTSRNDVWSIDMNGPAWTELLPASGAPSARSGHAGIFDPYEDRLAVFGGASATEPSDADAWVLAWPAPPAGTLSGWVRNLQGSSLPGARVRAFLDGLPAGEAFADGSGFYTMTLAPGSYRLRATAEEYLRDQEDGVLVVSGRTTALDFALGRILAGDAGHPPSHLDAWDFEQDHDVSWSSEPADVDHIAIESSVDAGQTWAGVAGSLPAAGSFVWTAAAVPDSATTGAALRFIAFAADGDTLGLKVGPFFALVRRTDVLLRPEPHVFCWPAGPSQTVRYRVDFAGEGLGCVPAESTSVTTPDAAPYVRLAPQVWSALPVDRLHLRITSLDGQDVPLAQRDTTVLLCDYAVLAGGGTRQVLLVHDRAGSPGDWTSADNALVSILAEHGFGVRAFAWPASGDLGEAAAGLVRASRLVVASQPPGTRLCAIGHGAGGLVVRAAIEGTARAPSGSPVLYAQEFGDVVTLGTPHLGEPSAFAQSCRAAYDPGGCGARPGPAVTQTDEDFYALPDLQSGFLRELNDLANHPLDPGGRFLLVAGDAPVALDAPGIPAAVQAELLRRMRGPGDGAVPARSALADGLSGIPGASCIVFAEDHSRLPIFVSGDAKSAAILSFLDGGTPPVCSAPVLPVLSGTVMRMGPAHPPAAGAIVRLLAEGATQPAAVAQADSAGRYVLPFVAPGPYHLEFSADGAYGLSTGLVVDGSASGWIRDAVLEPDAAAGPRDPWISLAGGSAGVIDSTVQVRLGASGASEMLLAEDPGLGASSWIPVAGSVAWTFHGSPGRRTLFARFRNAQGIECAPVGDAIRLLGAARGDCGVTSDSAGASVFLDGERAPGVTPVVLLCPAGPALVSVSRPGGRPEPQQRAPVIPAGGEEHAVFSIVPRAVPSPFGLLDPAPDAVVPGGRPVFSWQASADSGSVSTVGYLLQAGPDSAFASPALETGGMSEPSCQPFTAPTAFSDSSSYYWRVRATTAYGCSRWSPSRRVSVDRTPPSVTVLVPNGGESWHGGQTVEISWRRADWSGVDSVRIGLSLDGGESEDKILYPAPEDTVITWTVPDTFTVAHTDCIVRVHTWDRAGNPGTDASDAVFTIGVPQIVSADEPDARILRFWPPSPNPATGQVGAGAQASVRFALPRAQGVRVRVCDVSGRVIWSRNAVYGQGVHRIALGAGRGAGEAAAAGPLASGVYFVRIETDGLRRTFRFVVVR